MGHAVEDPDPDRGLRVLAWGVFALAIAGAVIGGTLATINDGFAAALETEVGEAVVFVAFPVVGLLVATKSPRNALGWLMLAIGLCFTSPGLAYARYAEVTRQGDLSGAGLALAVDSPLWVVFIGLSGFLLMLFPDGHLPSPRWRWFARLCGAGLTLLFLLILFSPGGFEDVGMPQVTNPLGIQALEDMPWSYVLVAAAPITVIGGAVAIVTRIRRTREPMQRQQLRWLAWAGSIIALFYGMMMLASFLGSDGWSESAIAETFAATSFVLIPITIGIAVLRYRLYDVDFVIRKTVVFAVMLAVIAVVYVGLVAGIGALVGSQGSSTLSAVAAAVVALIFQPVRTRARRLADRIVYGARATPYELLADFSDRVGETYAADDVLPRMARVVAEGIGAERAEVWVRLDEGERLAAVWPTDAAAGASPGDGDASFPVEHHGEVLGALAIVTPANDPMNPAKEKLVEDLAGQAGLVLRNVRLNQELIARLDDLRAAQRRLVTAQDQERKRLERNIHDGAQQQLVAMAVKLRLAEGLVDRDAAAAKQALGQLQTDATTALEDLRDLARGIYPPLLVDRGLGAALTAQANRSVVPVEVSVDLEHRPAPEVEAAVYFSCLECLQNVGKYAGASSAAIVIAQPDGRLIFDVTDDGRGFDPTATGYGTGLQGIVDRIGALEGTIDVRSAPGRGTTVHGEIPVT